MGILSLTARVAGLSLCLSAASCVNHKAMDAHAAEVATKTARYELHCESIQAEQISKRPGFGYYNYQFGVDGCEKSDVYTVACSGPEACEVETSDRVKVKDQK